jgi:hypothetical protein
MSLSINIFIPLIGNKYTKMRHMYMVWLFIFAGSAVGRQNAPTACGIDNAEQCACPPGTDFQTGTTYAMLGANAKEVQNLIANCKAVSLPLCFEQELITTTRICASLQH